jgi:hypothetical protein
MVQVAGDAFQMGGNETVYPNEQPVHSVTVGFFNMEKLTYGGMLAGPILWYFLCVGPLDSRRTLEYIFSFTIS